MNRVLRAAAFCAFVGCARADSLADVLARMDKAAPTIHAMTAHVEMVTYTAVIQDKTTEVGSLQMQKQSKGEVRAIINFTGADQERTLALLGSYVEIYYPKTNYYTRYDLGSNGQLADRLLLLGFGTSGAELVKAYDVTVAGTETVAGKESTKLQLIPKDADLRSHLAKAFLWIPTTLGYPVQQQFFDPPATGNWRIATYSQINLEPSISGTLNLKLPKNAKRQAG